MKLHDANHNMVLYIQYKFNEIPSFGYIVMSEDKKSSKFMHSKVNYSYITDDTLMKLHVHNQTKVIHIQYRFQEIPFIGYLVMAEGGQNH